MTRIWRFMDPPGRKVGLPRFRTQAPAGEPSLWRTPSLACMMDQCAEQIASRLHIHDTRSSASRKIAAGSSRHATFYPVRVIRVSVQFCPNVWSTLLMPVHEGGLLCGAGPKLVTDASQGLRLLQGFFHHFFDTLLDRFLHRFLDRLFHFLRIQTRAPGLLTPPL